MNIVIRGLTKVRNAIDYLHKNTLEILDKPAREWSEWVINERLAGPGNYAPMRPQQVYVRTYQLGQGWRSGKVGLGRWRIYNIKDYSAAVVGNAQGEQGPYFTGRWWKAIDRIGEERQKLITGALQEYVTEFDKRV